MVTTEPPTIEGFHDLVPIGRGGFSTVYAATQAGIERRVAVKVLDLGFSDEHRFQRECRTLGTLSAVPGIVPVLQATFTSSGQPCIVMQLMDGGSLSNRIRSTGPLAPQDVLRNGVVLCGALQHAHDARIFHRDIKPENVLFHGNDAAIADFGIALVDDLESRSQTMDSISPPHAPPERFVDGHADPVLGDVYSLGSTLYTALAGRPPFGTSSDGGLAGLIQRVTTLAPPPMPRMDVPADLVQVLERALAKDPLGRFQSMGSFAAALAAVADGAALTAPPIDSTVRRVPGMAPAPPASASASSPPPLAAPPSSATVLRAPGSAMPPPTDQSEITSPSAPTGRRRAAAVLWSVAGVLLILAIGGGAYLIGQRSDQTDAAAAAPTSSTAASTTSTTTPTTTEVPTTTAAPSTTSTPPTTAPPTTTAAPTTVPPLVESDATTAVDQYLIAASGFDVDGFANRWAYPIEQQYSRRNVDEPALRASAAEYFARFDDLRFERVGSTSVVGSAKGWETTTRYRAEQWPIDEPYKCETATIRLGFDRDWRLRTASEGDQEPC